MMHVQILLEQIRSVSPHAVPLLVISITTVFGLLLGSIRFYGLKLGVAGMLFSGIILGHFGFLLEPELLAFLKEFGLVLFIFTVGIQLGPGFFNSLKKDGIRLNVLALTVILLGALIAFVGGTILGWKPAVMAGIFTGATTNTPSLGAAQQMIALSKTDASQSSMASMAYAVTYPFAVMGIIVAFVLLRMMFRINVAEEQQRFTDQLQSQIPSSISVTMRVDNPNLHGIMVKDVPGLGRNGVILSRVRHADQQAVKSVTSETILQLGDVVLAIGSEEQLKRAEISLGARVQEDLHKAPGDVICKRVIVTNKTMIGKTIADTGIARKYGVTIARVSRQDLIMTAVGSIRLQFGDLFVCGVEFRREAYCVGLCGIDFGLGHLQGGRLGVGLDRSGVYHRLVQFCLRRVFGVPAHQLAGLLEKFSAEIVISGIAHILYCYAPYRFVHDSSRFSAYSIPPTPSISPRLRASADAYMSPESVSSIFDSEPLSCRILRTLA